MVCIKWLCNHAQKYLNSKRKGHIVVFIKPSSEYLKNPVYTIHTHTYVHSCSERLGGRMKHVPFSICVICYYEYISVYYQNLTSGLKRGQTHGHKLGTLGLSVKHGGETITTKTRLALHSLPLFQIHSTWTPQAAKNPTR